MYPIEKRDANGESHIEYGTREEYINFLEAQLNKQGVTAKFKRHIIEEKLRECESNARNSTIRV